LGDELDRQSPDCPLDAAAQDGWLCLFFSCRSCLQQAPADPQAIIDVGRGDVPLKDLRFRCAKCGSRLPDHVTMSKGG
jgi:hypothetical protein